MKESTNATKECKYCKTEIPKGAKVCPNCKKKQRVGCLPIVIGAIAVIIIIGALVNSKGPKKVDSVNGPDNSSTTETNAQSRFNVGDVVDLNGVQATLVSVTESNGTTYTKPSNGNIFLLCEFEISNNSNQEINVSSAMNFKAYADSYSINQSLTALSANDGKQQLDGSVGVGKKMNGTIGYEVPSDWKELEISYSPSFWSGKEMTFVAQHN